MKLLQAFTDQFINLFRINNFLLLKRFIALKSKMHNAYRTFSLQHFSMKLKINKTLYVKSSIKMKGYCLKICAWHADV